MGARPSGSDSARSSEMPDGVYGLDRQRRSGAFRFGDRLGFRSLGFRSIGDRDCISLLGAPRRIATHATPAVSRSQWGETCKFI